MTEQSSTTTTETANNPCSGRVKRFGGIVGACVFVGFWTLVTGMFDVMLAKAFYRQWDARARYATTTGTILSSKVTSNSDGEGTTYKPELTYSYTVPNQPEAYTGIRINFMTVGSSSSRAARAIAAANTVGSPVTVHYDPARPSEATLSMDADPFQYFMVLFMTPFNVIMVAGWCVIACIIVRKERPAGGKLVSDDGVRAVLRPRGSHPLVAAGATAAGVSFVSIFVLGFATRMNPGLTAVRSTLALVGGCSFAAFAFSLSRRLSGANDLVIDRAGLGVVLPRSLGRRAGETISFADIVGVRLHTETRKSSDGDSTIGYVKIATAGPGGEDEIDLTGAASPESLEPLAAYLREVLRIVEPTPPAPANAIGSSAR